MRKAVGIKKPDFAGLCQYLSQFYEYLYQFCRCFAGLADFGLVP
jgi:hypothetical protein